ncbi:MAG: RluA family pseudouridine synthase [Oscillospiraceae bacterium]|nr:RluA family pseudouridine synthase [Eubacteriales bacterium]MDY2617623.1 RluA family pseudouridine synthase [Oscillospiraceae bacterium]
MKEFTIGKNDAGQRLDRWMAKTLPLLPAPLAQKYIRIKRVKLNGARAQRDTRLKVGDVLQLYINDEFFDQPTPENAFLKLFKPKLDIVYEDEHILLVNKMPGMVVHADETEKVNTLINHIQAYLYQKKEWSPYWENSFAPALCNRIDRNTGGIVIAAKTAEALRVMNQKIRDRELEKLYLCAVLGCPTPSAGTLEGFIVKDEAKKQVSIRSKPVPGGRKAITKYRTLATKGNLSLVECDLITGRTHQIRAMMAHAGHPLLGDGKYGSEKVNRQYGRKHQALWSWKLTFQFTTDAGELDYLNGRSWQVEHVDFVEEYFPGVAVGCGADSSL